MAIGSAALLILSCSFTNTWYEWNSSMKTSERSVQCIWQQTVHLMHISALPKPLLPTETQRAISIHKTPIRQRIHQKPFYMKTTPTNHNVLYYNRQTGLVSNRLLMYNVRVIIIIIRQFPSLRFNGHFPGEPGLAGVYWSKGWWKWWWLLESSNQIITTNKPTSSFLQTECPSCRPTNSVKALKRKISHSMDLLTPSSPEGLPTLSLTTNSSWLPWGGLPCLSSALWCQYHANSPWLQMRI